MIFKLIYSRCNNSKYTEKITEEFLIPIIKSKIDESFFCCCELDDYYIPEKKPYGKYHFTHINFLHGYDDVKDVFYTFGYNSKGFCLEMEVPYKSIIDGYKNSINKNMNFVKSNQDNTYELDIQMLKNHLDCYLNPNKYNRLIKQSEVIDTITVYWLYRWDYLLGHEAQSFLIDKLYQYVEQENYGDSF